MKINPNNPLNLLPVEPMVSRAELQRKLDRAHAWLQFTTTGFVLMMLAFVFMCAWRCR